MSYHSIKQYQLLIFDMDGTLYFQRGVQIRMALRLLRHALTSRGGLRDLRVILAYRKLREKWDDGKVADDSAMYAEVAKKVLPAYRPQTKRKDALPLVKQPADRTAQVRDIIRTWMFEQPLDAVRACADRKLVAEIRKLLADGKRVCIYSDYPTEDKVSAVGLPADIPQFYPGKNDICTLKPDPVGLNHILSRYPEIPKEEALMIGDRKSKDGLCAERAGIDCVILAKWKILRR